MKYNPFQASGRFKVYGKLGSPIIPPRFIYHLDYSGGIFRNDCEFLNYKRMNIAKEGLFGIDMGNGGVWANVYQSNPYKWFPVCMDVTWECNTELDVILLPSRYDVWRIDTSKIKNKWFIDPNMVEGEVDDLSKVLYTPDSVSGKALQLFHMQLNKDLLYDYYVYRLDELIPVNKINEYIKFTHRRKRIYDDSLI